MKSERLQDLFLRYYNQTITLHEKVELVELINQQENRELVNNIIDDLLLNEKTGETLNAQSANEILSSIFSKAPTEMPEVQRPVMHVRWWTRAVVAASVCLVAVFAGYLFYYKVDSEKKASLISEKTVNDVPPGEQKAQLRLSNGKVVNLAAVANGFLSEQGSVEVDKVRGEVKFGANHAGKTEPGTSLNVLTTPMGGQYKLTLPDGSHAWLNAGSSLKFPDFFGKKRIVEMHGEVYFEIHPDKTRPFIVKVADRKFKGKDMEIVVLGTHFNINSYKDEPKIQTTLLEGSVQIMTGDLSKRLSPGQQAEVESVGTDKYIRVKEVDTARVIAWKEGRFEFNGNVKDIMRQIARWYNLTVEYEDDVEDKAFVGAISRKKNISEVLRMLELTGDIQFEVIDKRLIVRKVK